MTDRLSNSVLKSAKRGFGGVQAPGIDRTYGNEPTSINPKKVRIPLLMHIGKACESLVKKGDVVQLGQPIADSEAFVSAPIHASVSGRVTAILDDEKDATGRTITTIEIESDEQMTPWSGIKVPQVTSHESFVQCVRDSGLVGLGGAGFPTHVKFATKNTIDTLIANGAECEPYNSSDYFTMRFRAEELLHGLAETMHWLDINRGIIFIEDNKKEAIQTLVQVLDNKSEYKNIQVMSVPVRYPRGAEKVVIQMATGRIVPEGKLPADVNVLVSNVTTLAALGHYLRTGMPLVEKVLTVDGMPIKNPQNVRAPIGTEIYDVLQFCGMEEDRVQKVIMGGPMMGIAIKDIHQPIIKMNNAILALSEEEDIRCSESDCIRCARCIGACPIHLSPTVLYKAIKNGDLDRAKELGLMSCFECAACSYICPADIPLVHYFRKAKEELRNLGGKGNV